MSTLERAIAIAIAAEAHAVGFDKGGEPYIFHPLRDVRHEDEEEYIKRAADNEIGRRVKLADISDSIRQLSLAAKDPTDDERIAEYHKAEAILLAWPLPPDK